MSTASKRPVVSVCMASYNHAPFIRTAVQSVLNQSFSDWELVITDDGSTDGTSAVAASFGGLVRVVSQANAGCAAARNRGVRDSIGDHLAFLDADDLWNTNKLAVQLALLEGDATTGAPAPEIVFGHVVQFRSPELPVEAVHLPEEATEPIVGHHPGSMLLRRETFDAIGWFTEDQERGDFIDWFARALEQQRRIVVADEVLMRRRLHVSNMGLTARTGPEEYAKVLRRVIERRRAAQRERGSGPHLVE